jgi:hypothetical protein
LPGERAPFDTLNTDYFDEEHTFIPPLIYLQRWINSLVGRWYETVFTAWFWLGAVMIFICLYRHPFFTWATLSVLAADSVLLPTIVGMSMWRYVLLGMILMQYPLLAGIQSGAAFLADYFPLLHRRELQVKSLRAC